MSTDNDLPHQPQPVQQPHLMKKKSNLIWIVTVIPLLITNLQYLDFLRSWYDRPSFLTSFLGTTPHLSALLAINLVAASFYLQKKSNPNWIIIFTFLVMCNLIFYGHMLSWIPSPYLGLALVGAFPYLLILSVVDFIAVFIKKHPHDGKAYIALFVISLVLFFSGIGVFQMSFLGLDARMLNRLLR